ncbi:hypothetical protein BG418_08485 [Streptomyces sp. CBMA152]|nr:hypothetical protein [Streptomyces sp. CBMA152]
MDPRQLRLIARAGTGPNRSVPWTAAASRMWSTLTQAASTSSWPGSRSAAARSPWRVVTVSTSLKVAAAVATWTMTCGRSGSQTSVKCPLKQRQPMPRSMG